MNRIMVDLEKLISAWDVEATRLEKIESCVLELHLAEDRGTSEYQQRVREHLRKLVPAPKDNREIIE